MKVWDMIWENLQSMCQWYELTIHPKRMLRNTSFKEFEFKVKLKGLETFSSAKYQTIE